MTIIQTVEQVRKLGGDLVFVDVRIKDAGLETGRAAYDSAHIPGAIYLDFKADLSGEGTFLPDIHALSGKLGELGISKDTVVVFYDEGTQRAAAKAFYVFDYLGHEQAYILQGGYQAWKDAGEPISGELVVRKPLVYTPGVREKAAKSMDDVKEMLANDGGILIDSRAPERYRGEKEPKYEKAGHIPGAVNFHSKVALDENGHWKEKSALQSHFKNLNQGDQVVVSCGSGNSATMNYVALKEAGFKDVSLYAGGFSEWIADDANKVAKGDEDGQN